MSTDELCYGDPSHQFHTHDDDDGAAMSEPLRTTLSTAPSAMSDRDSLGHHTVPRRSEPRVTERDVLREAVTKFLHRWDNPERYHSLPAVDDLRAALAAVPSESDCGDCAVLRGEAREQHIAADHEHEAWPDTGPNGEPVFRAIPSERPRREDEAYAAGRLAGFEEGLNASPELSLREINIILAVLGVVDGEYGLLPVEVDLQVRLRALRDTRQ